MENEHGNCCYSFLGPKFEAARIDYAVFRACQPWLPQLIPSYPSTGETQSYSAFEVVL